MKPRMPSAAATDEDSVIWWNRYLTMTAGRIDPETVRLSLECATVIADRRDADRMLIMTQARAGLNRLKKAAQVMYDGLTPHEQDVMRRLWGARRPE